MKKNPNQITQGRLQARGTLGKAAIADKCKITTGCELFRFWHCDMVMPGVCMLLHSLSGNTQFILCAELQQKPPVHRMGWR